MLGPDDPLPRRPRRITVAGTSGAGKTTTAARVGAVLGIRHVETDALHHGPGWVPRPEFLDDVRDLVAGEDWVCEWQYARARPLILARADLMVWVDPPVVVTMAQVVWRTLRRRVTRQVLWNGNVEPPLRSVLHDPDHVVRWAWRTRRRAARQVAQARRDRPDLVVVRLRSRRARARWLTGALARSGTGR
ncbi:AAA family ATPase [Arsenicicoccus dermatophilus]|uniref:AAA family ATPase n=1 Tax=Arsenicicoccus dermatophilus TaxID=1076331 RepID=UPI00391726F1